MGASTLEYLSNNSDCSQPSNMAQLITLFATFTRKVHSVIITEYVLVLVKPVTEDCNTMLVT